MENQAIILNLDMDSEGKGALEKYNRLFDEINKIENASFPEGISARAWALSRNHISKCPSSKVTRHNNAAKKENWKKMVSLD